MPVVKRRPVPKMNDEQTKNFEKMLEEERCREKIQVPKVYNQGTEKEIEEVEELDNREEEVITDNTLQDNKTYNLEMFQPATSKTISRSKLRAGVISVVNSSCGKRVILSRDLMDKLNNPTTVAMSFSEEKIAIGVTLPNNDNHLAIKPSGKKGSIYSSGIVLEITDRYRLNFNNRTSITFSEVNYIEVGGDIIAIINAKQVN